MTPKEKAYEIYEKFAEIFHPLYHEMAIHLKDGQQIKIKCKQAKKCALLAVETVLSAVFRSSDVEAWKAVKTEIELIPELKDTNG